MKYKYILLSILTSVLGFFSCTNLDEEYHSYTPQSEFGKTTDEISTLIGPAYGTMRHYVDNEFWMGEISSDEYMIPARGLDWLSGGKHLRYHTHEWTSEADNTPNFWKFAHIVTINKIIAMLEESGAEIDNKEQVFAELRGLRAFWYFVMLDNIGNVPIVTKFESELPKNNTRKEVYDFVESELLAIIDDLTTEKSSKTYTKFTRWVGYTLLAKLYLNAEVYSGTAQWDKCREYCDYVINSNNYSLESDYFANFAVENEGSKENIFSIPFDENYFKSYFIPYQMSWHYNQSLRNPVQYKPWNGPCAVPSFVKSFDADDVRYGCFLIGPQYALDGSVIYNRDNTTPLNYTVDMVDFSNATENEGARLFKWEPEVGGRDHLNNDFAVFRYADILLMKAECLLRTGNAGTALTIVNDVRRRNFDPEKPLASLDLDLLLRERGYEFVFEGWRRNDLIRFDKFGGTWDFKPNPDPADKHTYLFPIPLAVLQNNPNLVQNPGY
ncbi:MAG: RagB/SusD family nutrient uptake outer membrane protein [Dysgonomonas sp.]